MSAVADISFYIGYALLASAFARAAFQLIRDGNRQRVDILVFIALALAPTLVRGPVGIVEPIKMGIMRLLPWGGLRLVRHFRSVSRNALIAAVAVALAWPALVVLLPFSQQAVVRGLSSVYMGVGMLALAATLFIESRRSAGAKAHRVRFAAVGMSLHSLIAAASITSLAWSDAWLVLSDIAKLAQGLALICFYFAFATPRPLLSRWRRNEQAHYLTQAMGRDPEERGRRAADDLFQAAVRGVGGAVTLVALRDSRSTSGLRVVVASDPSLVGRTITPNDGLFGRATITGRAAMGPPSTCESDLGDTVLVQGGNVLAVPVVADSELWGLVVVAQRRGALFPEDDLEMLSQVSRNAATALDHQQLIAERRRHERREAEERLREIESRVDLMLDSIKDYAMLVLESDGRVAAWHLGAEIVFGHPRAQIAGTSAASIYEMSATELAGWLHEARTRGRAEREGMCRRADGSTFIGTTTIRPLAVDAGDVPGFVAVTHDVTDRRDLEERLRQGQKMEAIGQLAGGVAHDFNNLLTAIIGYADWLDRDLAGDPRRDQVTEIQKAADRAADLTRQLLAFSRRQMLRPSAIDLAQLTTDLVPMLRRLIGEQIEIVEDVVGSLPAVMADRSQIEQIILNLAVNARDAMPDGGRLTIRVDETWLENETGAMASTLPAGPYALIEVSDTGTGMDAETTRRVFEPFFTTKEVGRGTGLGLSTVYGIVQQMGGAIDLETTLGGGTTFRLYFPQLSEIAAAAPLEVARRAQARGNETLLLVEDDLDVRTYLSRVLESQGYRVIAAEHARAALAFSQASGERIDLVISDVVMPGSTGPELVRLLGQAQPNLSALFISGHEADVLARHAGAVNETPLLQKPFSSRELLAKVRQILSAA